MKKTATVNERIDEVMLDRGLNPQELATKINRHVTTVTRILSGETTPGNATVKSIADALECPVEYLVKGTGPSKTVKPESDNPYRDYSIQRLEREVEKEEREKKTWQEKYDQLWEMFSRVTANSFRNPVRETA